MSKQIDEMNLPIISVPALGTENDYAAASAEQPVDTSIVVGSPNSALTPEVISVYAESITSSGSFDKDSSVCTFDIVFHVGICEGDINKTYRVVKRIGIDKVKIACEAECSAPVSVVEGKTQAKKQAADATAKRFRILAGLE